ncbi:Condensation domain-containing protein [Williamsia sterculiae]|uniref:Condensation domain-containing protein n=2 Tax=Williamsia sterculiae TaxID=1344003 RepID=A0A1N7DZB9_9NOCA|nr:Condensation domain-containing protein [Williamsia sterculiae]
MMDQTIEPGALVEWSAHTEGGLGAWSSDSRPTSYNHEQHLRGALEYRWRTHREGGRESWLGLAIEFDEPMSVPAIRSALTSWIDRHEVLRSHVVLKHSGPVRLSTMPGSVRLRMGRIGWYTESGPLLDQIAGTFDRATAPLAWPAYHFATVARERSFTLLFAADHSLVDGYSLILAQHELTALYRAARDRTTPALMPVGSYVDFSAHERRLAEVADIDDPAVQAWERYLRDAGGRLPDFFRSPTTDGSTAVNADEVTDTETRHQSSLTSRLLDDGETNRFTAVCSAAGGSLFAGVLSALALAYREERGEPEFRCVIPRHTRNDAAWLTALGWFVAVSPFRLDTTDLNTFDQVITRATTELRSSRIAAGLPFLRVAELLGHRSDPKFVVSFIDTRFAPGADAADAGAARVLRSHNYSPDEVYLWVNRTPSGLRISARFPAHDVVPADDANGDAYTQVSRFLAAFAEVIRQIGENSTYGTVPGPTPAPERSLGGLG